MSGCLKSRYNTHTYTHGTLSHACALMCPHLSDETVCRKLRVHPAQPDVPAGGRGSGSVQQDHSFGQDCQQEPQPGRRRPYRLLQSTEQAARTRGETRKVHNRDDHADRCPGDTFMTKIFDEFCH